MFAEILNMMRTNALSCEPFLAEPPDTYIIELPNTHNRPIISQLSINAEIKDLEQ